MVRGWYHDLWATQMGKEAESGDAKHLRRRVEKLERECAAKDLRIAKLVGTLLQGGLPRAARTSRGPGRGRLEAPPPPVLLGRACSDEPGSACETRDLPPALALERAGSSPGY